MEARERRVKLAMTMRLILLYTEGKEEACHYLRDFPQIVQIQTQAEVVPVLPNSSYFHIIDDK